LAPGSRAFAAGGGSFPWPFRLRRSQGKNNILRVLCASVVNFQQASLGSRSLTADFFRYALCALRYAGFKNYIFVLSDNIHYTSVRKELNLEED